MELSVLLAPAGLLVGCGGESAGTTPSLPPAPVASDPDPVRFVLAATHDPMGEPSIPHRFSGGLAAGDIDGDGDVDIVATGSDYARLFRNRGDGTFEGRALPVRRGHRLAGPAFGDTDGDGDLDLFVGAADGDPIHVFENRIGEVDAVFVDVADQAVGVLTSRNTPAATFYDYDRDGFLDLFLAHWGAERRSGEDTPSHRSVQNSNASSTPVSSFDLQCTTSVNAKSLPGMGSRLMISLARALTAVQ